MSTIKDPLMEPFYIGKDNYCYTVYEVITPEAKNLEAGSKGKIYEKPVGHFSSFGSALKRVAKCKTNLKEEYSSIKEYLQTYKEIENNIESLINTEI